MYVNDSSEEGSTYKPSEPGHEEGEGGGKERGEEEVCLSHNLVEVLIHGQQAPADAEEEQKLEGKKGKKVVVKKEPMEPSPDGALIYMPSKDMLGQEPMRSFMQRAQHRLRAYIAVVNAWPRKQGNIMEKKEVPEEMMNHTLRVNAMYQMKDFMGLYNRLWSDLHVRDTMVKQVCT